MPVTESPLRYPGGKTQLTPFVIDLTRANDLYGGVYAEPFAGGAGIAWRLLLNGDMTEVWLNDIDQAIFSFWDATLNRPDELCERIRRTDLNMDEWRKQRAALLDAITRPDDLAFAALFMNRTNRSGILKGGAIGGKEQTGNYKLDCRFNRDELIEKIQRIHAYRDVVRLSRRDAKDCIRDWAKVMPRRALLNIDPPYFTQGRDLYLSFYTPDDHAQLARLVRSLKVPWMLTYDDAPEIEGLYEGMPLYKKSLVYYAQVKRCASEILVLSKKLVPPEELLAVRVA